MCHRLVFLRLMCLATRFLSALLALPVYTQSPAANSNLPSAPTLRLTLRFKRKAIW